MASGVKGIDAIGDTGDAAGSTGDRTVVALLKSIAGAGGGPSSAVRIQDVNGDSAMDEVNDSLRVSVVSSAGGGLTDAELRATPVPVSGTVAVTEPVSIDDNGGSLTVDGPLTDAQLRATPVPVSGTVAANAGTNLNTSALALEATLDARTGALTEAAPATDTASSGLNGRLQRIAQRITSLIALLPASLGQKAMSASLAVTVASDQAAFPVTANAGTNLNTSALALSATQTDGTQKAIARGGAKGATTAADLTSTASGVNHQALDALLYDASGNVLIGQKAMAGSIPVVVASDQAKIPVSISQTTTDNDVDIATWIGSAAPTVGSKTSANSLPVVVASDQAGISTKAGGDVDHDVANTLLTVQVGGHASPVDVPPTAVSANADRVRAWLDRYGSQVVRRRKIRETYTAVFRLGETTARLDQTFTHTANTNKQWATLHHTVAASTKEVRLQLCIAWITSATAVAPVGIIELRQISAAPVTGNPAITPTPRRRGGTAAEAVALYLPTTAGTEANVDRPLGHHVFDEAVSVATVAFQHPQGYARGGIILFDASQEDDEAMQPVLPVGALDGWAIVTRLTGATAMRLTAMMVFTEETP